MLYRISVLAACASVAWASATITIPYYGTIIGLTATAFSTTSSSVPVVTALAEKFIGIPFAEAPTGTRRFMTPVPRISPYAGSTLSATKSTPTACFQYYPADPQLPFLPVAVPILAGSQAREKSVFNDPFSSVTLVEQEDCLYLNVFRPVGTTVFNRLPVMIWLYGGNAASGSSSLAIYDGSAFAYSQNVIIVTFNYRMNIFGFSGSSEIPKGFQNAGLFDQRLAVNWVSQYITNFGGDPNRITVFGQSAGAWSIKQMIAVNTTGYTPVYPGNPVPVIQNAILESQGLATSNSAASWNSALSDLGCNNAPSPLICMQGLSASSIQTSIQKNARGFTPILDGLTAVSSVYNFLTNGSYSSTGINIMIGSNANEAGVFEYIVGNLTNDSGQNYSAGAFLTAYAYFCPADFIAYNLDYGRQYRNVNYYEYFYQGNFSNLQPFPNALAYHSAEVPIVFNTFPGATPNDNSPISLLSRTKMQAQWANFASSGNSLPNTWNTYSRFNRTVHVFSGSDTSYLDYNTDESNISLNGICSSIYPVYTAGV